MSGRTIGRAALIFVPLALTVLGLTYPLYAGQASAIRTIVRSTEERALDLARPRVTLTIGSIVSEAAYLAEQDAPRNVLADGGAKSLIEVLRRIRADSRAKVPPLVILTSSKEERDVAQGYRDGCNTYVRKPVSCDEFVDAARQLGLHWMLLNEGPRR